MCLASRHSTIIIFTQGSKMKNSKHILITCFLSSLLVACGGGGDGDNVSSSGANNASSSNTGTSNSGQSNSVITTNCSSNDSGKTYLVTGSGCLVKTSSNTQTAVCSSATTIKLLTGTSFTKDQVVAQGSSFTSNNLTINGIGYKCV